MNAFTEARKHPGRPVELTTEDDRAARLAEAEMHRRAAEKLEQLAEIPKEAA